MSQEKLSENENLKKAQHRSSSKQSKRKLKPSNAIKKHSRASSNRSEKSGKSTKKVSFSGKTKEGNRSANLRQLKIGFIGAGKMTESIVRGLLRTSIRPDQLFVTAKSERNLGIFSARQITTSKRPYDVVGKFDVDVVFLAVHGCVVRACFKGGGTRPSALLVNYLPHRKHPLYVLSLVGGVLLTDIRATLLDPEQPEKYLLSLYRVCLNAGVRYGLGVGAVDVDIEQDKDNLLFPPIISELLCPLLMPSLKNSSSSLDFCREPLMDSLCALTGNGLAFVFYFITAMANGGAKIGLNKVIAVKLAAQSFQSAARCLLLETSSSGHPSELQDRVTSEAGPASYGLGVLDEKEVSAGVQSAIEAAFGRIRQLVNIEPIAEVEVKAPFT